ncbi:MAG: hypothetical protein HY021_00060, partial [Burkholderiales bacterium]|nr:hypothetical protein [Burkholderiales bacterium]
RAFIEVAAGRIGQRYGLPSQDARRASLDLSLSARPAPGWRAVLSDRLDDIHPVDAGSRATLNSLREAYVGWQDDGGQTALEFGRINLRNGPAYGYNPTDFFRDGALRAITTADPLALRENRMGTVMLRGQRVWSGGSVSLALAPKVDDRPSDQSFSADFGATNHSSKALLTLSGQPSDKLNGQLLAYAERGKGLQVGANLTALLSDAAVGFVEWTAGRDKDLLSESRDVAPLTRSRQRAVAGLTYTTSTRLSITGELEFNGFASRSQTWANAGPFGTELLGGYLLNAQRRQESASRQAVLIYATQKGGLAKNLDITGLLRINTDDNSRFTWAEARYHWASVDLALQWQHSGGKLLSAYGVVPTRSVVQVLAAFYF